MTEEPFSKVEPEKTTASQPNGSPAKGAPRVFVSYAHETPEHKHWVRTLAADLRKKGVDALLDTWDLRLGADVSLFMDEIESCDRVLLICTPTYARKAKEGKGGVGYERSAITAQLVRSIDTAKYICVLRIGKSEAAIPIFARNRQYIDFRDDSKYEVQLKTLLHDLLNTPADPKPPLGQSQFDTARSDEATKSEEMRQYDALIHQAKLLLSNKDMLGWKGLVRTELHGFASRLSEWRQNLPLRTAKEELLAKLSEGVEAAEPLLILAMTAVYSEIESVRDQSSLLEELLYPEDWPPDGRIVVERMPHFLAFVYHHLLGSLLVSSGAHSEALRLLSTMVRHKENGSLRPLCQDYELSGHIDYLPENAQESWHYIRKRFLERPWLAAFFRSSTAFQDCLRAYAALGSTLGLSHHLGTNGRLEHSAHRTVLPCFYPMFLLPWEETGATFDRIIPKAIPDLATLKAVAHSGKTDVPSLRAAWQTWITLLVDTLCKERHLLIQRRKLARYIKEPPPLPTQ